jgi:stage II sporulation protein D
MFLVSAADLMSKERLKELGSLKTVRVAARSKAGWAKKLTFVGEKGEKEVTGDAIRGVLGGVRSNLLWLEPWPSPDGNLDEVVVYGGGWGHGVGMCQVGAYSLAREGRTWREILKHYYPKASLKEL